MTAFPRWEYVRNYVTKYFVQYGEGFAYSFSILTKLISDDVLCTVSRGTEAQFYLHGKSWDNRKDFGSNSRLSHVACVSVLV